MNIPPKKEISIYDIAYFNWLRKIVVETHQLEVEKAAAEYNRKLAETKVEGTSKD